MSPELQNQLFEKYPNLFANKDKTPMQSPMCFGIEVGDGWYELLASVCWRISQHEKNIEDRKRVFKDQPEKIQEELEYFPVKFDQVKEKYRGLRLYFSGGDSYVEGVIDMAEEYSYKICEVCGNKGEPNKEGWISTRCEAHRNS